MNLNLLSVALLITGSVLVYSAVNGYDPRDVVKAALAGSGSSAVSAVYKTVPTTPDAPGAAAIKDPKKSDKDKGPIVVPTQNQADV